MSTTTSTTENQSTPMALPWVLVRARVLHRAFLRIKNQADGGRSLVKLLEQAARRLHGRKLRDGQTLCASYATLRRAWYQWEPQQTEASLMLQYRPTSRAILTPADTRRFLRFAVQPGVWSFLTAHGLLLARAKTQGRKLPSYATLLRAIPAQVRAKVAAEHRRRRKADQAEKAFARFTRTLLRKGGKA